MATKLLNSYLFNNNRRVTKPILKYVQLKKLHTEIPVKEIQIPVKWGHVAAKLWGNSNDRPILALHGWQDNAGTWDTLAPSLSKRRPILAIDFPGHGLSSWIPAGMQYYPWELPRLILHIKEYFKWDKVSLLCHSMGSIAGMRFASVFPEDIDFYIALDNLVYDDYDFNQAVEQYPKILRKIQATQELKGEPPCYTKEEIRKIWHLGTGKSVAMESVDHLLKRGAKASTQHVNKYYFCRDPRLKVTLFSVEDKNFVEALIQRLNCPTLYIKSKDSPYGTNAHAVEMREIIAKNNKQFECIMVAGTHHVHLNNPESIEPCIVNFLTKHQLI